MTPSASLGGLLGFATAIGVLLAVLSSPPLRPVRLTDRVAPYLGDHRRDGGVVVRPSPMSVPFASTRQIFGAPVGRIIRMLDRAIGGAASIRRRLDALGVDRRIDSGVEAFRIEQVLWGAGAMVIVSLLVGGAELVRGSVDPVLVGGAGLSGAMGGVLARDRRLTREVAARNRAMLAELPVVADLFALSVLAGEGPVAALARVVSVCRGEVSRDLDSVLRHHRSGVPIATAIADLAERSACESFARFLFGLAAAIERGTPLAETLRGQALDAREATKRALLASAGRKEISMMLPVVFLVLPVTVLFALYPGLLTLTSIAR